MKKNILTIIFLLMSINACFAVQLSTPDTISAIENSVFGYEYTNESDIIRVERIEEHLYGQKKSGNILKRIENIQNDSGLVLLPEKPQVDNNLRNIDSSKNSIADLQEDSTVEYPMVDKIEQELFSSTYKKENIYKRLDRLEEKVFGKTSNEDLNTRVEKLANVIRPKNIAQNQNYNYTTSDMDNYYNNSGLEPVNEQSVPFQLAALEEDLLRNAYMNENISNRLSRLEQKLFNRTFSTDTDVTRLQRIMVAYDAKKNSYKYENNKKMQNMATMTQIGGILLMILAMLL